MIIFILLLFNSCEEKPKDSSEGPTKDSQTELKDDRFRIIGKWDVFEDENSTKLFGTLSMKKNGEAIMYKPGEGAKVGLYSFDYQGRSITFTDHIGERPEPGKVRIVDKNRLILAIEQSSGVDVILYMTRVN